jgi:hypothetical protein
MSEQGDPVQVVATNRTGRPKNVYHLFPQKCPSLLRSNWRPVSDEEIERRDLSLCKQCEIRQEDVDAEWEQEQDWSFYRSVADKDPEEV